MKENKRKIEDNLDIKQVNHVKELKESLLEPEALLNILEDLEKEKKKAEESENIYKLIFEASQDAIFWVDLKTGKIIRTNSAAEKLLEKNMKELIGMHQTEIHPPEKKKYYEKVFKEHLKNLKGGLEAEVITKSGKIKNVEINTLVISVGGKTIIQGIFRDITEKKKAEAELKRLNEELKQRAEVSEEKYRTIYESSADAIMILEPPTWKFTAGNPTTIKMFGAKDEAEFTSLGPGDFSPEKQPDGKLSSLKAKTMIMKAMKEGNSLFEWTHKRLKDGDFPATVLLTRMKLNGRDVLQATVRDITKQNDVLMDLKERTVELENANEDLMQLDVAKSDFLNMISHELKTPLTSMIAHLDVLGDIKMNCIDREDDKIQCGLSYDAVKRGNFQLSLLIENLLEVARMQAKTFKLDIVRFSIKKLITEVVADLLSSATQKELKLHCSIPKSIVLRADRNRVREILVNLITNAIKFTEKGEVFVKVAVDGKFISISVKDTGIGIKKDDLPKLFKKFFQVESGLKRGVSRGTGLGLSIVNELAQLHGGNVSVKSEFGKGSTFTVKLPLKKISKISHSKNVTKTNSVKESLENYQSKNVTRVNSLKGGAN